MRAGTLVFRKGREENGTLVGTLVAELDTRYQLGDLLDRALYADNTLYEGCKKILGEQVLSTEEATDFRYLIVGDGRDALICESIDGEVVWTGKLCEIFA